MASTSAEEDIGPRGGERSENETASEPPPARTRNVDGNKAAALIQRNYRGYRERRQLNGMGLSASVRWTEALKELKYRQRTRPLSRDAQSLSPTEFARSKWREIGEVALRAGTDDTSSDSSGESGMAPEQLEEYRIKKLEAKKVREKTAKMMDLPYFLEMVDTRHRYGSNLRAYHNEWKKSSTHENFFYWLDNGEGRKIEVPTVTRERLEREQVRYLSREERQQYLVKVDSDGRLCWAKNDRRITTSMEYRDSLDGIVPVIDDTPTWSSSSPIRTRRPSNSSTESTSSELSAGSAEPEGEHYVNNDLNHAKGFQKLKYVSAATILNRLLQKSVRPNSWIFVADTSFRLYIGIKKSGAFQHSSFLHGGRISAAGLIKIKDGQLRRLSPLSGHYRPPTKNFRQFVHSLKDSGVDMSRVSISRSYAMLVGLEAYVKTRQKVKHGIEHAKEGKDKILHPEEVRKREEQQRDKRKSAEPERQVLESERIRQEQQKKQMNPVERLKKKIEIDQTLNHEGGQVEGQEAPEAILSQPGQDPESGIPPEGKKMMATEAR